MTMRNLFNHGRAADEYRRRQDLLNHGFELLREPPQVPVKREKRETRQANGGDRK